MSRIALIAMIASLNAVAPAQDYETEVAELARASRLRVKPLESDAFIFASTLSVSLTRPIAKAADDAFKQWQKISGVESWKDMWGRKKCLVIVCNNKIQHRRAIAWYDKKYTTYGGFGSYAPKQSYWPQPSPRVTIFMHARPISVKHLRNVAAHVVGHMCVIRYGYNNRPSPPWLEEGFGCYLEARVMRRTNCYCFGGGYGDQAGNMEKLADIEWKKWKETVRKMVRKKSDKPLKAILPLRMNQIAAPEMGKSWSIIDYLITQDRKKFCLFLRKLKTYWPKTYDPAFTPAMEKAQERALRDSFDLTLTELDEAWRKWAKGGMK
ncbi:MAG: hypothetical protein CMJ83_04525 [Planctomycetes bacterium]|nr:hypothetical protein [Planctomycetota bacterium]